MSNHPKFAVVEEPAVRVRHLFEFGSSVDVDPNIPPRRYFRSGLEMIRMATIYMDEGNLESAYVLFSKFITLFVEKLPQHPEYKTSVAAERIKIKKKLKDAFPVAEAIKVKLVENYKTEYATYLEQKAQQEKLELERLRLEEEAKRKLEEQRRLEAEQNLQLQSTLERLKLSDVETKISGVPELDAVSYDWPNPVILPENWQNIPAVPSRDLKPIAGPLVEEMKFIPSVDRTVKPSSLLSPGFENSDDSKLRSVIVPVCLLARFLSLAQKNTSRNVETCGILTGKLAQNKFTITHLIVPKQLGTADSCTTENEEEIFEIQDQNDLVTLGWIHTHPSQTSFMSSVDLHTHSAYQLMLPEAIAIVCSPKFDETGVFSLTSDYGLKYIASCYLTGFHPHPKEPPLYAESTHVIMDSIANITVVDLR